MQIPFVRRIERDGSSNGHLGPLACTVGTDVSTPNMSRRLQLSMRAARLKSYCILSIRSLIISWASFPLVEEQAQGEASRAERMSALCHSHRFLQDFACQQFS